jgi:MFS family permease
VEQPASEVAPPHPPNAPLGSPPSLDTAPWYAQVTSYQWLVLAIASAGWIFDAFEGQVFNITRQDMLRELVGADPRQVKFWGDFFVAAFLVGGAAGGIGFGSLADKIGRKPVMALTILFYSIFSGATYFVGSLWGVAVLRFLVALGVGGEWAVGASIVAEVFPSRARARAGAIFHGSSIFGTWIAAGAGLLVGTHWRYAYLLSVAPALLLFAVQVGIREPERWRRADAGQKPMGSFAELFGTPRWARHAIFGLLLAAIGLGTFWSVVVAGQDLCRELLVRTGWSPAAAAQQSKFAYGIVQASGMFFGLLAMGPLSERLGRRGAFLLMHVGASAIVPITCYLPHSYGPLLALMPAYGFFTGGMHAGYAIYFPELFPDNLRATGAGVCFNGGRFVAAPMLWLSAMLKEHVDLRLAVVALSSLYILGIVFLLFLPETRGRPLPGDEAAMNEGFEVVPKA